MIHRRLPGSQSSNFTLAWSYLHDGEGRLMEWRDGNDTLAKIQRDGYGRMTLRYVPNGSAPLSTMTTYERFVYADTTLTTTYKTFQGGWMPATPTANDPGTLLDQIVVQRDGLGRLLQEDFGFNDNGSHAPLYNNPIVHGYAKPGGGEDASFRRSLHLQGTDWKFQYTPDAAGKLARIDIAPPRPGQTGNHVFDDASSYTYEGGRVATRAYNPSTTTQDHVTTMSFDDLGYLASIDTLFTGSGGTMTVFSLERGLDLAGNVLWRKYDKVNGRAGDYYQLDGFNRVQEAKLGVPSNEIGTGTTYNGAQTYDEKLSYVLDRVNNWDSVTSTTHGTTDFEQNPDNNEYLSYGPVGAPIPLTYDQNGNLVADGRRIFVYDYLDRLCEIHVDSGSQAATSNSSSSSKTSSKKPTKLTLKQTRTFLAQERAQDLSKKALSTGIGSAGSKKPSSRTQSSTSSATSTYILWALYGYDPGNRRIYRSTFSPLEEWWYSYNGSQVAEEYSRDWVSGVVLPKKVDFDGVGIDEHVGFALLDWTTQTWSRYLLTQDALGNIHALVDPATGTLLERYEYGPYGQRTIFRQVAGTWVPTGIVNAETSDYGFTGRRHDVESGLTYYRNRYYWPKVGRFLSLDPVGIWEDESGFGNGFTYGGVAPSTKSDPLGWLSSPPQSSSLRCIVAWNAYDAAVEKRAKDFKACSDKKFKEGLAWNAGRWIVTGGTSTGIYWVATGAVAVTPVLNVWAAVAFAGGVGAGMLYDYVHIGYECAKLFPEIPTPTDSLRPIRLIPMRGICVRGCHGGVMDWRWGPNYGK